MEDSAESPQQPIIHNRENTASSTFNFKTFYSDSEGRIDLGSYTRDVAKLNMLIYEGLDDKDELQELKDIIEEPDTAVIVVTNHSDEVVGFGSVSGLHSSTANFDVSAVKEGNRGKGIYRELVRRRVELAMQNGVKKVMTFPNSQNIYQIKALADEGFNNNGGSFYILDIK